MTMKELRGQHPAKKSLQIRVEMCGNLKKADNEVLQLATLLFLLKTKLHSHNFCTF